MRVRPDPRQVEHSSSLLYLQSAQPFAAQWSSSMIPSSGTSGIGGGPGFNSRLSPFAFRIFSVLKQLLSVPLFFLNEKDMWCVLQLCDSASECFTPGRSSKDQDVNAVITWTGCSPTLSRLKETTRSTWPTPHNFDHSQLPIIMASSTQRTTSTSGKATALAKNDNDVVIVAAVRSAMTKVPSQAYLPFTVIDIHLTGQTWWLQGHPPRGNPLGRPSCSLH